MVFNHPEELVKIAEASRRHRESLREVLSYNSNRAPESVDALQELTLFLLSNQENGRKNLNKRQREVFVSWIQSGVRFDTAHWLRSLAVHFGDSSLLTPEALISAFFIDIFNRADDVMDTFREEFTTASGEVTTAPLRETPILQLENGSYATVGECIDILMRLIKTSGTYYGQEIIDLNRGILAFLQQSRSAIEHIEKASNTGAIEYGEQEALKLREDTLYPLVTLACQMYSSIRYHGTTSEDAAMNLESEMRALAMTAQVLDDCNDWKVDYDYENTNIALGVLADACSYSGTQLDREMMHDLRGTDEEEDNYHDDYSDNDDRDNDNENEGNLSTEVLQNAHKRLNQIYTHYYSQVNPEMTRFLPKTVSLH